MKRIAKFVYDFINSGGWRCIIVLGYFGVILTIIAIYGKCGFNWSRFIFADIPLFSFCGWALYKMHKLIINNKDIFK